MEQTHPAEFDVTKAGRGQRTGDDALFACFQHFVDEGRYVGLESLRLLKFNIVKSSVHNDCVCRGVFLKEVDCGRCEVLYAGTREAEGFRLGNGNTADNRGADDADRW